MTTIRADGLSADLYRYMIWHMGQWDRRNGRPARWVMSGEWLGDVVEMAGRDGRRLLPPVGSFTQVTAFGYPLTVEEGAGVPRLVS